MWSLLVGSPDQQTQLASPPRHNTDDTQNVENYCAQQNGNNISISDDFNPHSIVRIFVLFFVGKKRPSIHSKPQIIFLLKLPVHPDLPISVTGTAPLCRSSHTGQSKNHQLCGHKHCYQILCQRGVEIMHFLLG